MPQIMILVMPPNHDFGHAPNYDFGHGDFGHAPIDFEKSEWFPNV